ncbi:hypothetical protein BESB_030110 [Besnoitia besnoiti]|uniref:Uncharacterized protein n=1 Tax=Besnoitia besnoiti TaxID=94643 RepID=A0A2A9M669_BESBE|nr:hypothetical protein BESB_030110 [Besnoitia besnoiti]PFH31137.1 hypothetical protein BESB_030110 [Besnoitia besnoiti]
MYTPITMEKPSAYVIIIPLLLCYSLQRDTYDHDAIWFCIVFYTIFGGIMRTTGGTEFASSYQPDVLSSGREFSSFAESLASPTEPFATAEDTPTQGRGGRSRRRGGSSSTPVSMTAPGSPEFGASLSSPTSGTTTSTTTVSPTYASSSDNGSIDDIAREMPGDVIVEERDGEYIYFFIEEDGRRTQLENAPPLEQMEPDSFFTEQYLLDKPIKLLDQEQQEKLYKARMEKPTTSTRISVTRPTGETDTVPTREERREGVGVMALPPRQQELGLL